MHPYNLGAGNSNSNFVSQGWSIKLMRPPALAERQGLKDPAISSISCSLCSEKLSQTIQLVAPTYLANQARGQGWKETKSGIAVTQSEQRLFPKEKWIEVACMKARDERMVFFNTALEEACKAQGIEFISVMDQLLNEDNKNIMPSTTPWRNLLWRPKTSMTCYAQPYSYDVPTCSDDQYLFACPVFSETVK